MPENKTCQHTATTKMSRGGFYHYVCKNQACKKVFSQAEYKEHLKTLISEAKK